MLSLKYQIKIFQHGRNVLYTPGKKRVHIGAKSRLLRGQKIRPLSVHNHWKSVKPSCFALSEGVEAGCQFA